MDREIIIKKSSLKRIRNITILLAVALAMITLNFSILRENFLFGSFGILVSGYSLFLYKSYFLHGASDILINQYGIKTRFFETNKIILIPWEYVQDVWAPTFIRPQPLRLVLKKDERINLGYSRGINFLMGFDRLVVPKRNIDTLQPTSLPVYLNLGDDYEKSIFEISTILKTKLQKHREKTREL